MIRTSNCCQSLVLIAAISCRLAITTASSATAAVDWQSASGTTATGHLGGTLVTMTGLSNAFPGPNIGHFDLSGADYSGAPLSSSQETINYAFNSTWTVS